MDLKNYSVEATVCENGKYTKGTLTLFIDEYVFGKTRTSVVWEETACEQGVTKVKSFLFTSEKPYVVFRYAGESSPQFILEQTNLEIIRNAIEGYTAHTRGQREAKLAQQRQAEKQRLQEEKQVREEARRQVEAEERRQEEARLQREADAQRAQALLERKRAEKQERIQKEVESCKNSPCERPAPAPLARKAAAPFLENPYRILGISCVSTNEEANTALDKLKKLARLKALEAFQSPFDLAGMEKPIRDLRVSQNALAMLKDKSHKWFWFSEAAPCCAWYSGKYRMELSRDGQELGTYDLFLANYLYAVLCDSKFETAETWKRILNFYCYICAQEDGALLKSRFSAKELENKSHEELLAGFKKVIFEPLLQLCDTDDLVAVLRLHRYIKDCDNKLLDRLSRTILEKVAAWFTGRERTVFDFLAEYASEETLSEAQGQEIRRCGEQYCQAVERVLEPVLTELRGELVRYDMIKESYRKTTYQLMYQLHKCADQSDAIFFANKTYTYCKEDDRRRIRNTFGEANIKFVDWNVPHTGWDIQGDNFYFGRGCQVDYTQAVYWYHKAADAGNMHAQNSLGLCYQKGTGVPQSDAQAVAWFEKACESGNPEGAFQLAECCFTGTGTKKDIDRALELWAEAAKLGHPTAGARRQAVFAVIQAQRKARRAKNHICHDIGFQMPMRTGIFAEVTLNQAAYAYLVNAQGYQNYLAGKEFSYQGGFATSTPYRIGIPSANHWYVIVDNGDDSIAGITATVRVKTGS